MLYEVLATPLTYAIVNFLKRHEGIDSFDYGTNFNPFRGAASNVPEAVLEVD